MRRAAGLLLVGVLLAIAPWADAGPLPTRLLERHKPVLVLHPAERFAPSPVEGFLADSDLKQRAADGSWQPATGVAFPPTEVPGCAVATCWRLDQRACAATSGLAAIDCYAAAEAAHAAAPVVYGAVFRSRDRIALQYWLFYAFNLWSPTVPQTADFWQSHEGDWEAVTVVLDSRERPLYVGASRHCGGARKAWAKASRRGGRPVVLVALGSHAHYFSAGARPHDPRCWPSEAVAIYKTYGVAMLDHAAAGRTLSSLRLVPVTAATPAWMAFPGGWGEDQYARFPNATFKFGAGPRGPVFHELWRKPFGTPAAWRAE